MVRRVYRFFKRLIINTLIIIAIVYAGLYILLSIPTVQQKARNIAVRELSARLNVPVGIGSINIQPFNKLTINDLYLPDREGDTLLYVNRVMAGFEWAPLRNRQLIVTNAQLFGFDIHIRKEDPDALPNFQFVIDAFRSRDTVKKDFNIDLQIRSLLVRRGHLRYDLLSAPEREKGSFDKNHIEIRNFLSTVSVKTFRKDSANIYLKRLSFEEKSGFSVDKLTFRLIANKEKGVLQHFNIRLPESEVNVDSAFIDYARVKEKEQFADSSIVQFAMEESKITPADLSAFAPVLQHFHTPVNLSCQVGGVLNHLTAEKLTLHYADEFGLSANGSLDGLSTPRQLYLFGRVNELYISPEGIHTLRNNFPEAGRSLPVVTDNLGTVRFRGEISGFFSDLVAYGRLSTALGEIQADIMLSKNSQSRLFSYNGTLSAGNFHLGLLFPENNPFGDISFKLAVNGEKLPDTKPSGKLAGEVGLFDFKGHSYKNIALNIGYGPDGYEGILDIDDIYGKLSLEGIVNLLQPVPEFRFTAKADGLRLHELQLIRSHPHSSLSFMVNANFTGNSPDRANGNLTLDSLLFTSGKENFFLKQLSVTADNDTTPQSIRIRSDLFNGEIKGAYTFNSLPASFRRILSPVIPSLVAPVAEQENRPLNDFSYAFTLHDTEKLSRITGFPLTLNAETIVKGYYSDRDDRFRMEAVLPRFRLKKFRFEEGSVWMEKQGEQATLSLHVNNRNKKDKLILLALNAAAHDDRIDMKLNWSNTASTTFSGALAVSSRFARNAGKYPLSGRIDLQPSNMIINDTIWNIHPAEITVDSGRITVDHFEVRHQQQYLRLSGTASADPDDEMSLQLQDINLDYIFQTLNVNHVNFGGNATGDISISNLLKAPILSSRKFDVTNFAYNDAVLGDLHLFCRFDAVTKGIFMEGGISQPGLPDTEITGQIYPGRDSLGLHFDTHKLNLAFLRPFVGKVMQDMSGYASGKIDFYGKFSALTVTGDAYLQDVFFGIDYLNTTYSMSDSLHLRPGSIYFDRVTLKDKDNHTALVRGMITHRHFKDLTYDIGLSNANNLLVYNVSESQNPVYFGTVYGSGAAQIQGDLSGTSIDVNLRTGPHSAFTYVLDKTETAGDYQFITFKDGMRRKKILESIEGEAVFSENVPAAPEIIPDSPHNLNLNLQIDATPDATFELILDPATGDVIKANGSGSIRIEYNPLNSMKMYGTYTLDKGSYSFNLQDLIIKDFSITPGSNISFRGSPLQADLDIQGSYTVTADLKDLDESFADQKELQRTSVPVQTIVSITGDLQRPDLAFNIELPTLTQDIERRVKSIISTEDMMNRQIIYLLALGKFYTPDYMNTGQRSNELVSVASSTLSSQLNNMLGQISDNWNIGTNIRSDKGDFSDVEFELALSSQLLNNRLILNGNFGYRDNTMSNNNFIGDFDLEYLLSASGNLRLKAYNHYNDRNYYIKSALTTQGVGIIFKRDFNRFSDLFYRIVRNINKRKEKANKKNVPALSLPEPPELPPEEPHPEVK